MFIHWGFKCTFFSFHLLARVPYFSLSVYLFFFYLLLNETLPIITNQSTLKRGDTRNKMEEPTSKKTKEPPSLANHKGNIKFMNPLA
jgi:hypothetical protein